MNGIRRFFGVADLKGTSITLYTFSQILNISVFEKADILQLVMNQSGITREYIGLAVHARL